MKEKEKDPEESRYLRGLMFDRHGNIIYIVFKKPKRVRKIRKQSEKIWKINPEK